MVSWSSGIVLYVVLALWVSWDASHAFGELRSSGWLELLLISPLGVDQMVRQQEAALFRRFRWPVAMLLAVTGILGVVAVVHLVSGGRTSSDWGSLVIWAVLLAFSLELVIVDLLALSKMGMWFSLTSKRSMQAWGKTLLWVELAPLVVCLLPPLICLWPLIPLILVVKSALMASWARDKLTTQLRSVMVKLQESAGTRC